MTYSLDAVVAEMVSRSATNAHLKARTPVYFRVLDKLVKSQLPIPSPGDLEGIANRLLSADQQRIFAERLQLDTILNLGNPLRRYRLLAFKQRDTVGLVLRNVPTRVPTLEEIGMPHMARELLSKRRGIILVTGPALSGKTTTVAAILNTWIQDNEAHIITLEDPVEYILTSDNSLVTQRQIGEDTATFTEGLRNVLRQDPDIIFVGELDSLETIGTAMAAAETGHLVISTIHAPDVASGVEQLIGAFPSRAQENVRIRLSASIQGVLSQVLIPSTDGTRQVAVFEIMTPSEGIRNLIRLNQSYRITDALVTNPNCSSFEVSVKTMIRKGLITQAAAHWHLGSRAG